MWCICESFPSGGFLLPYHFLQVQCNTWHEPWPWTCTTNLSGLHFAGSTFYFHSVFPQKSFFLEKDWVQVFMWRVEKKMQMLFTHSSRISWMDFASRGGFHEVSLQKHPCHQNLKNSSFTQSRQSTNYMWMSPCISVIDPPHTHTHTLHCQFIRSLVYSVN